jgi:phosphatidylglycerol---prolipoprotein diacylglyceryl transferase
MCYEFLNPQPVTRNNYLTMYPEICTIGPVTIYSYGAMLAVAFMVSVFFACRHASREGIDPNIFFNLCFNAFISGIIGARLFFVIENAGYYLKNPLEILMFNRGGLSWFGGLMLGVLAGVVYLRFKKIAIYRALDLLVPYLALAQAIGRIGCFLNGCCYGKLWAHGLYFPVLQGRFIPTQLYSSALLLLIFFILRSSLSRPHKEGQIFYAYLFLYSLKRFSIEFLRVDNPPLVWGLTLFHLLSIAVFCIAVVKLLQLRIKK